MRKYHHLSLEEREKLYALKEKGVSLRTIAKHLGRTHTTLGRELRRNAKYGKPYIPCRAHEKYLKRGRDQRYQAPLKNPLIYLYIRKYLKKRWAPEVIAGRLPIDYPGESIVHETIYRYIYKGKNKKKKLWRLLTLRRKKRMKKLGRTVRRDSRIPNAKSIDLRPKVIDKRVHPGHWESDNMEGIRKDRFSISVTVERVFKLTHLTKVSVKKASSKTMALTYRLGVYPKRLRKTLTLDNGSENTNHQDVKAYLDMNVYFCHAYHSWEKGTVENTVGRVRRYIPKGVSIDKISEEQIQNIEDQLNNTPRKCLGFLTPYEKKNQIYKRNRVY